MRLFKQLFRDRKTGAKKQTSKWYVEIADAGGVTRRMPALTAKAQSEEFGKKVERLVACRIAGTSPEPELVRWVTALPAATHSRLLKYGLIDANVVGTVKP